MCLIETEMSIYIWCNEVAALLAGGCGGMSVRTFLCMWLNGVVCFAFNSNLVKLVLSVTCVDSVVCPCALRF